MQKFERQQKIKKIISKQKLDTHQEILDLLAKFEVQTNQATLCRDLKELCISKTQGYYQIYENNDNPALTVQRAGDNLFIVKTKSGQAMAIAAKIDALKIKEVIATIAGDDAIFVAVKDKKSQKIAIHKILKFI